MATHVEEYLRLIGEIRVARDQALAAWEAMPHDERILAMGGERDQFLALAAQSEAEGQSRRADWHRRDAARIQERIDEATRPKCPTCGQVEGNRHD